MWDHGDKLCVVLIYPVHSQILWEDVVAVSEIHILFERLILVISS